MGHFPPLGKHSHCHSRRENNEKVCLNSHAGLDKICCEQEAGRPCQRPTAKRGTGRDPNLERLWWLFLSWQPGGKPLTECHLSLPLKRLKNTGFNNIPLLGTEKQEGKCNKFAVTQVPCPDFLEQNKIEAVLPGFHFQLCPQVGKNKKGHVNYSHQPAPVLSSFQTVLREV